MQRKELSEVEQRVLRFLLKNEGATVSDVIEKTMTSPNAIKAAIDSLIELGLVAEKREEVFPRRRLLYLTEKGRMFAKALDDAYRLLEA